LVSPRRSRSVPRAHWGLWALGTVLLLAGLSLAGYADHRLGAPSTGGPAGTSVFPANTGPVIDLSQHDVRSVKAPRRTVALTFDDGPDSRWTPEILDVLHRHHVPATFFVIGARAAANPSVIRRIRNEGHEIGSHTYSHQNLTDTAGWERSLQLSLTQTDLAGTVGIHTNLFRPPYSSTPDAVSLRDLRAYRQVASQGYLIVLSDLDSEDWQRPGTSRILANASPRGARGAVVLMHDGGGDRSQTVAALDRLITRLQQRHYRFATVSDLTETASSTLGSRSGDAHVQPAARIEGRALVALQNWSSLFARALQWLLLPIGLLALARAVTVVALARRHQRRRQRRLADVADNAVAVRGPVTVIVPAYNEAAGIADTITTIAASTGVDVEIIVVDDGSSDDTAAIAEALNLSNVTVISQTNGGKPSALNTGIAAATHPIIVMVDGDTVFEPDTVANLLTPFADPSVGAVSGNTKVGNRSGLLGRWQHIEYVMGFNLDRRMYEELNCMPTVPGAIGAFRLEALDAVGGLSEDTLAEDTDLTMAINRAGWRVVYEESAVAWTEAPSSLSGLWRQRYRWSYGTMQAMWKHRHAIRDRDHRGIGRRALPYLVLFQVLLPMLAPAIDLYGLYGVLFLDPGPVLVAWIAFTLLQLAIAAYAFRLDHESLRPLWAMPLQQFVYRQLMELVVIQSLVTAALGTQLPWQRIDRQGTAGRAVTTQGDPARS
jgi:cellulose synthase/poly-beta-1,6-N-acetylglucosamine synthase-like glycosyltransferase/peptidoglycan/xylan/chitin deacetylase (PgdA/CDA1 family)